MSSVDQRLSRLLDTQPLAKSLRDKSHDLKLERSVLAIPPADRADNFTTGTLGAGTAGCDAPPAVIVSPTEHTVLATFHIGKGLTGHVGYAHGGSLATIFDECCGRACLTFFQQRDDGTNGVTDVGEPRKSAAVTAQLTVSYVAPVPVGSLVLIEAVVDTEASKGNKATAKARLWVISDESSEGTLSATASGLFIEPKRLTK